MSFAVKKLTFVVLGLLFALIKTSEQLKGTVGADGVKYNSCFHGILNREDSQNRF